MKTTTHDSLRTRLRGIYSACYSACRINTFCLLIALCGLIPSSPSFAAICLLSNQTLTFGTINPQSTATIYTSGTATLSCSQLQQNTTISACLAIGSGNGAGSTTTIRKITSGGSKIPIVIKSSPSAPQEIGTGNPYPQSGPLYFLSNASGNGSVTFPISIALSGPITVAPGTYSNTFNTKDYEASYQTGVQSQCSNVNLIAENAQLIVQATVVAGCTVTASPMNFGAISVLTSARSATSTITLNCTQGVTASIGLDNGQTGTSPTTRQLNSSNPVIEYGIYQDSAHFFPWGQTAGINTVSLPMGQSTTTSVTAFGFVPTQGTPTPGTYTDVVRVTITY